jgi:glutamate/tyrosine decarboxylase-like PLP-dependent enzyme
MYFAQEDWPGGAYHSPTVLGSRSGGPSAAMWAALVSTGEEGYLNNARKIMGVSDKIRAAVAQIPELRIMGKSTFLIAITSDVFDPYFVNDHLHDKGWRMNGCQNPLGFHFCITLPQTQPGVAEQFIEDLKEAVEYAKHTKREVPKTGFLYGMAGTEDGREMMRLGLKGYLDAAYEFE